MPDSLSLISEFFPEQEIVVLPKDAKAVRNGDRIRLEPTVAIRVHPDLDPEALAQRLADELARRVNSKDQNAGVGEG